MTELVECHAGYTYAERPTALLWGEKRLSVIEIIEWKRTPEGRYFRVKTEDDLAFVLIYDEACDVWHVREA
jgi:hypothetical protein